MNTKEPQVCDVTEIRFRTVLTFLRIGSIPANMKKLSVLTLVYNALVLLHGYAMYLAFLMDSVVHRDDLKRFMKTFRSLVVASLVLWLDLNLR
jgi:hypothetical protein